MKNAKRALLIFSVITLSACGEKAVGIEEKVLMEAFSGLSAAQAYDHVCQKDSLLKLGSADPKMVNLMGNTQMLAYRISGFMRERRPDDTVEDAVARLQDTQKLFAAKAEATIKKDGCDSPAGKAGLNSFNLYTSNQPGVVHELVDQEIIKRGGTPILQKVDKTSATEATPEQLNAAEAASGDAPPVDYGTSQPPAWGEWVKKELKQNPFKAEEQK